MNPLVYAALCLAAPAAWGAAMYFLFEAWDRRHKKKGALPPIDYSI